MRNVAEIAGIYRFPAYEAWRDHAACAGMPTSDFFPATPGPPLDAVVRICARCPVSAECHAYARRMGIWHGVWGGTPRGKWAKQADDDLRPERVAVTPDARHEVLHGWD